MAVKGYIDKQLDQYPLMFLFVSLILRVILKEKKKIN